MTLKTVVGYCRESTKDQALLGFNIDDQEKKIRSYFDTYCENSTLEIMRDEGASAKNLERPVFKTLMKLIVSKKIDVLIIHNLDRLTRKVRDLSTLLDLFGQYNVELVSITERIDTTSPMGRFFIYLIVLIAQWEQDTIGDRTKRGVYESAAQGNYSKGGPPPLGFKRVRDGKTVQLLTVDEVIPVIQDIFEKLATNAFSIKSLVNYLNTNNVLGINWYQSRIFNIVNNPIYYGEFSIGPIKREDFVPAIVTKETYYQVQQSINGRKLNTRNKYIFKDKIRCCKCNTICTQEASNKKQKIYKYYYCPICNKRINEARILKEVDYDLTVLYVALGKCVQRESLETNLKKNHTLLNEITAAFENDLVTCKDFRRKIEFYKKEINHLGLDIKTLDQSKGKISFSKLSYTMQRKLLCDTFEYIKIDVARGKLHSLKFFEKSK